MTDVGSSPSHSKTPRGYLGKRASNNNEGRQQPPVPKRATETHHHEKTVISQNHKGRQQPPCSQRPQNVVPAPPHRSSQGKSTSDPLPPPTVKKTAGEVLANINNMLTKIDRVVTQQNEEIKKFKQQLTRQSEEMKKLQQEFTQLRSVMMKEKKECFKIKDTKFEAPLRSEIARVFTKSLTRTISANRLQKIIASVMKDEAKQKYKFDAASSYCKTLMNQFRSEERRRVYGLPPTTWTNNLNTRELAENLSKYYKAPESTYEVYRKNLALLRKFSREVTTAQTERFFHKHFEEWFAEKYESIDNIPWEIVMNEDDNHVYGSAEPSFSGYSLENTQDSAHSCNSASGVSQ